MSMAAQMTVLTNGDSMKPVIIDKDGLIKIGSLPYFFPTTQSLIITRILYQGGKLSYLDK